jgi:hypothetical protein
MSVIAIRQLEESNTAIAIPQLLKEMVLRNCNLSIPQSQFFQQSAAES